MKKTKKKKWRGMEGANRVYRGSWANSELAGGFCWRMSAQTSGETERGFGKKERLTLSNKSSSYAGYGLHDKHPVLRRLQSRLLLFPGIRAIPFSEYDISFFTFLISEVLWKLMT